MTAESAPSHSRLANYVPAAAVDELTSTLKHHGVRLVVTRARVSKLGDYRFPSLDHPRHTITINGDLNPYMFLLVLLHEVAHLLTFVDYGRSVRPHGAEWARHYVQLLAHYHSLGAFPAEADALLRRYTARLPLHRATGQQLERLLRSFDPDYNPQQQLTLADLPEGSLFVLRNHPHMVLRSVQRRRTRYHCVEPATGRAFLVQGAAPVIAIEG